MLKDAGDKLTAADKAEVESAMAEVKKAIDASDTAAMNAGMEKLVTAQHKAAESLYRGQAAPGGPGAESPGGPESSSGPSSGEKSGGNDDVIDAEVVDDKK
jgi:molecular chaperone DnaK